MSEPKIYPPKCYATERETRFGKMIGVNWNVEALIAFAKEHTDERGQLRLTIAAKRNADKYGTHSVFLDTFKPQQGFQQAKDAVREAQPSSDTPTPDSDVPF